MSVLGIAVCITKPHFSSKSVAFCVTPFGGKLHDAFSKPKVTVCWTFLSS